MAVIKQETKCALTNHKYREGIHCQVSATFLVHCVMYSRLEAGDPEKNYRGRHRGRFPKG